ncbi:MAG TPA: hypothetical protein VGK58_04795, partial [Lacipirellulaceae bacterium]
MRRNRTPRSSRRGVLLLVVLSMLVLFMLIGTTFLMTSNQERQSAKKSGRADRLGNHATKLLDRALLQVVRGTENPYSAIRGHDLLSDLYGTDGFQGIIYSPPANQTFDPTQPARQVTRYAGGTTGTPADQLGPTQGQLIDIYVRALGWKVDDPQTPPPNNEASGPTALTQPDLRHVLKLERGPLGQAEIHTLSLTKGYYSGCVLTITSGPATGQSARIVDYDAAEIVPANPTANPPATASILARFRVMAFERAEGGPLQVSPTRPPEIVDLVGATFLVNGRPFNGTGVGYNPLAAAGTPRLNAVEVFRVSNNEAVGAEVALLPNPVYFNPPSIATYIRRNGPRGSVMPAQPFALGIPTTSFLGLNPPLPVLPAAPTPQQLAALQALLAQWKYPSLAGLGGADEPYDAADYQNMYLALMTVTPRAQARVFHAGNVPIEIDLDTNGDGTPDSIQNAANFRRLDLEDVPLPSFHRPELVNFWYHRLLALLSEDMDPNEAVRAILRPYEDDGTLNQSVNSLSAQQAALIAAIKRKIMLRPIREDHPVFDGGNPQSVARRLGNVNNLVAGPNQDLISIPFWEVTGPWDVDNNGDGVPDSVWVYLGDPVQELEDGTRYKALYAFLVIDLDSRLNVNAHGLVDHIKPPALMVDSTGAIVLADPTTTTGQPFPNLAGANSLADTQFSSSVLAQGLGYGTAEISLRPLFPAPLTPARIGRRDEVGVGTEVDSYAAVLVGRQRLDGSAVSGKYGFSPSTALPQFATPGLNYEYTGIPYTPPDVAAQLQFIGFPWAITQLSVFGSPPDLMARYAVGLDYTGQPTYEALRDWHPFHTAPTPVHRPLLTDSPYELDISSAQRRDTWSASFNLATDAFSASLRQSDDAPFATADLERILRGGDADAGTLPSRLWDVVDVFDPVRRMEFDRPRVLAATTAEFGIPNPSITSPEFLTAAQQMAAISRNLVTTDSFDLPVPGGNFLSRLINGADGQPGRANVDDNDDGVVDDPNEQGWGGSDDFHAVMNGVPILAATAPPDTDLQPTPPLLVPQNANIVDLLRYRVQFERLRRGLAVYNEADLSQVVQQLLAPEVIAGRRMDLNRPFGDGRDNGDGVDNDNDGLIDDDPVRERDPTLTGNNPDRAFNDIVDDPLEAGDPFVDSNASPNGRYDAGEVYYDRDGNGQYTPPLDRLWAGLTSEEIFFDYNHGSALLNGRLSDGRPYDGNGDFIYDPNEPTDGRVRANGVL